MIQLTQKQQEIIDFPARVKLVMGGMRSGKTILAIMAAWDMMTKSASYPRVLFLTPSDRFRNYAVREIKGVLLENIVSISKEQAPDGKFFTLIKTDRGEIFVSDHFIRDTFEGIVYDNATSSKYLYPKMLDRLESIYLTGHCPQNINNTFFLMWLKAYFSDNPSVKSFHINTEENPAIDEELKERGEQLRYKMGESRYNRDYLCIPDFTDCIEPNPNDWMRHEFVSRSAECNQRIEFKREFLEKW